MRRFIVLFCCVTLVLTPMRRAEAFVAPVPALAVIGAAGPIAWTVAGLAAAVAAGVAIYRVAFKDSGGADVLDIRLNPKAPTAVPSGWTAPALPGADPVPPATTGTTQATYYYANPSNGCPTPPGYNTTYTAPLAAAQACVPSTTSVVAWGVPAAPCAGGTLPGAYCSVPGNIGVLRNIVTTCPAGYTFTSPNCNLTNAPAVPYPPDAVGNYKIAGGVLTPEARDPDNALPANVTAGGTQIKVTSGTSTAYVKVNGDGTLAIETHVGNGNGTTTVTKLTTAAPNAAAPDGATNASGVSSSVVTGEGSAETTTPVAGGDIVCINCAIETTQQQVKAAVESLNNDGVKLKEDAPAWATQKTTAESAQTATTAAADAHEQKFAGVAGSGLSALGVPGLSDFSAPGAHSQPQVPGLFVQPAACAPVISTWGSKSISFDVCPVANFVKPILEWFLYGLAVLYVYGAFWRRPQGST